MRRTSLLGMACLCGLVGCSASSADSGYGASTPTGGGGSFTGGSATGGGGSGSGPSSGGSSGSASGGGQVGPGILTAGMWDDNLNYDFFGHYLTGHTTLSGNPGFVTSDYGASHATFGQRAGKTVVDAALVLDTTGSMGDELSYLTAEFANVWGAIASKYPGADQRWALVLYRDTPDTDPGDDYVVRTFDFMTSAQDFSTVLGQQSAGNGGDYPESPERGLEQLPTLSWRTDPSVAKLAFWVGDAPQHDYRAADMKQAILGVRSAGVHVYPVSASGTDDLLELTMRSAAQLTGGRYMFLTDDSGVGDPHKIPEIPCYTVTKLEKALVRGVGMELTGGFAPPDPADVIRVDGTPAANGTCTTQDGQTVTLL